MKHRTLTQITGNLLFALISLIIFSSILIVSAVAPGSVKNPFFGPQEDDVQRTIAWDATSCRWSTGDEDPRLPGEFIWSCTPSCGPDEVQVGKRLVTWRSEGCFSSGDKDTAWESLRCCKLRYQ